jgi:hypothetical protein
MQREVGTALQTPKEGIARSRSRSSSRVAPSKPLSRPHRNLTLVARQRHGHTADFRAIAGYIRDLAPDIHPKIISDRHISLLRIDLMLRPTLTFSPLEIRRFRPIRGPVVQDRVLKKSQEYTVLDNAGVPVPRWALVTKNQQPDLSSFSDYVVTKPDVGGKGADVKIKRRGRVRWKPADAERAKSFGDTDLIVQEFIYTGPWPVSYRVTTLFGQVLFSWKVEASRSRRPLSGPEAFCGGVDGGGMSIVSSGGGCTFELNDEPDILRLAKQAHKALPDYPLLGIDIVRQQPTGRLFVLELNSCGHLWHFSSPTGLSIQRDNHLDFAGQFDGLRRAAEVLVEQTRTRAW